MSLATFIADSSARSSWRARPRSFVALMGLYESNYTRLGWLVEDIRLLEGACRSVVAGDCDLVLTVIDRGPYTATFTLTYDLGGGPGGDSGGAAAIPAGRRAAQHETPFTVPDMAVRVYHDARVAEAQGWAPAHDHAALQRLRSGLERELDQRWARNTMLNKWLEYCAERGHRFPQVKARP
jgi:uncharacterized protein YqiB (DUF1249 family)